MDLNSCTGEQLHFVPNIQLNHFVDLPVDGDITQNSPRRFSNDKAVNNFGMKLLNLCKENNLVICNGCHEDGCYTYYAIYRNRPVSSLVDYVVTNVENFKLINNMCALDINEFSDHCAVVFSLKCTDSIPVKDVNDDFVTYEKLIWDSSSTDILLQTCNSYKHVFDDVVTKLSMGQTGFDSCIDTFSDTVHDISFQCFGKKVVKNQ